MSATEEPIVTTPQPTPPRVPDWPHETLEQLTFHAEFAIWPGLEGLTDEEYLWEPVPHMASLRPRSDATPGWRAYGSGAWVVEYPPDEHPSPHPTTIAWRLAHITLDIFGERWNHHAGDGRHDRDDWRWDGTAETGVRLLREGYDRWVEFVTGWEPERWGAPVGPAEGPFAEHPYASLVLHCTREFIHHCAEVRLLRDLHAATGGAPLDRHA